ncbi:unnamed protein product [Cylicocyclus nassatus]|uniref:Uncharacterized protein n=1 Tax=Cylicocyclus nassatus TaxID=53992 RepID=A0AA36MEH9_CYLNA|nr:unnamed protein product [Cylicocyclus nassatus]
MLIRFQSFPPPTTTSCTLFAAPVTQPAFISPPNQFLLLPTDEAERNKQLWHNCSVIHLKCTPIMKMGMDDAEEATVREDDPFCRAAGTELDVPPSRSHFPWRRTGIQMFDRFWAGLGDVRRALDIYRIQNKYTHPFNDVKNFELEEVLDGRDQRLAHLESDG